LGFWGTDDLQWLIKFIDSPGCSSQELQRGREFPAPRTLARASAQPPQAVERDRGFLPRGSWAKNEVGKAAVVSLQLVGQRHSQKA